MNGTKQLIRHARDLVRTRALPSFLRGLAKLHATSEFVVTGLPRSGTSLLCAQLNTSASAICFNETVKSAHRLPTFFRDTRQKLTRGEPVENRFDAGGELTTDTLRDGGEYRERRVQSYSKSTALGAKATTLFLSELEIILALDYPIVVIMRDPLFSLLSWNSAAAGHIPEHTMTVEQRQTRFADVNFLTNDRYEMQAQIWEHFAHKIWEHRSEIRIVKYESLVVDPEPVWAQIASYLDIRPVEADRSLSSRNDEARYAPELVEDIRRAVDKYCPTRHHFGYE